MATAIDRLHFSGPDWSLSKGEVSPDLLQDLLHCGSPGSADAAVAYVRSRYQITGDPAACAAMLNGYGAWERHELADHDENLNRLVWLTGCALRESGESYFCTY